MYIWHQHFDGSVAADNEVNSMQPWQCVQKETPEYMYQFTHQQKFAHQLMRSWQHRLRRAACRRLLLDDFSISCKNSEDSWDQFADSGAVLRVLLTMQALHLCLFHVCLKVWMNVSVVSNLDTICLQQQQWDPTSCSRLNNIQNKSQDCGVNFATCVQAAARVNELYCGPAGSCLLIQLLAH